MSHLLPQHQYIEQEDRGLAFSSSAMLMLIAYWLGIGPLLHIVVALILSISGYQRGRDRPEWGARASIWFVVLIALHVWLVPSHFNGPVRDWSWAIVFICPVAWWGAFYLLGTVQGKRARKVATTPQTSAVLVDRDEVAGTVPGLFGREVVVTNPRGATLVLGPPGKGKTMCVVEPTVAAASGPTVSASVKWEIFYDTCETREKKGKLWALDLGSGIPAGAQRIRWSPLSDVRSWDSAGVIAKGWAKPYAQDAKDGHWVDSAADWLQVILYAARDLDATRFSSWCRRGAKAEPEIRDEIIMNSRGEGDVGAELALETLDGLMDTPENERGSILSTLRRMTAVYNSEAILSGEGVEFDSEAFIHTCDTVYIAASTEEQYASAGLVNALLQSITSAQKRAYNNQENSQKLSVVIDEVANVAQPPLDEWASQFGGQDIALTATLQDLSQARKRWPGVNMLALFPTTILMPNIKDEETLRTISLSAGKFDRTMVSTGSGTSESTTAFAVPTKTTSENVSVHTQREDVLPVEAIAQMPIGEAMVWGGGADWWYIRTIPWDDPYWGDYREAVPTQWVGQVDEVAGPKMLESSADTGETILHEARVLRDRAEGKHPQHDVDLDQNQWGR